MSDTYLLEFELDGLPKMSNQLLRGHWSVKAGHAKTWKRKVWSKVWHLRPRVPLMKAQLTLTRCSSAEPDFDGLVSSMKHIIDGLVEASIISNDKMSVIGQPTYKWEKASPGKGKTRVLVESVESYDFNPTPAKGR